MASDKHKVNVILTLHGTVSDELDLAKLIDEFAEHVQEAVKVEGRTYRVRLDLGANSIDDESSSDPSAQGFLF